VTLISFTYQLSWGLILKAIDTTKPVQFDYRVRFAAF
jgi:hypothetical protein